MTARNDAFAWVQVLYLDLYPGNFQKIADIATIFNDIWNLFKGKYPGYRPCDTNYHDADHTFDQALPIMVRIIRGMWEKGVLTSEKLIETGLVAVLLHDTGYIKKTGDNEGTGAKYTFMHILRSCKFARNYLKTKGYCQEFIRSVENIIRCTGVNMVPGAIQFNSEEEKLVGFALGTADLLGQMAQTDYIGKLPFLYHELEEGWKFAHMTPFFSSVDDLIQKTPTFWRLVKKRLVKDYGSTVNYLPKNIKRQIFDRIKKNIDKVNGYI